MIPLFKVYMHENAASLVAECLSSGQIAQGPLVEELEVNLQHVVASPWPLLTTNSCTSALDLAYHLAGIKAEEEVIVSPQTCFATVVGLVQRGAKIVWADVDALTGLISTASVAEKVGSNTAAIVAVDWAGRPCDYTTLQFFGPPVIEDAAHAWMTLRNGLSLAYTGGDYVCWSFQAIKHLTTGDGGLLRTPEHQTERARLLRWYGLDRRSESSFRAGQDIREAGYKYHMNDIAATIGLANLYPSIDVVKAHQKNAAFYGEALENLNGVRLPPADPEISWWLYTILVDDRDSFSSFMHERGVQVSQVHVRLDQHTSLDAIATSRGSLPGLDHFAAHQISIPVGWWLTDEERSIVADAVIEWSGGL